MTMTELQEQFEEHGIHINHVFLFDFLIDVIEDYWDLHEEMLSLSEEEATALFGPKLARRILGSDPDLSAYLQDAGGVFIRASCDFPDPKHVDFDADGKATGWRVSPGKRVIYAWKDNLSTALHELVRQAEAVANEKIAEARKDFQKLVEESAEE